MGTGNHHALKTKILTSKKHVAVNDINNRGVGGPGNFRDHHASIILMRHFNAIV